MSAIPPQINEVINRTDRVLNSDLLPKTNTNIHKYDGIFMTDLSGCQVQNLTEFDYGRAYCYQITMSLDPDAAALDRERVNQALRRCGSIERVNIAVSALLPLFHIKFIRCGWIDDRPAQEEADSAFSLEQEALAENLFKRLANLAISRIDPTVAATLVPDVESDLHDKGEMTIADCLFYG